MIELSFHNGNVFVFDVDDWETLRRTHRIVGTLIGSTTIVQGLPLKLLPEEVLLLVDKGLAKVVDRTFDVTPEDEKRFQQFENELLEKEKIVYKETRKRQLESMIDDIVAAKRKRGDERPAEEIFNEELEKSSQITKENMIWPIFLKAQNTVTTTEITRDDLLKNLNTVSELRSVIFKDLWERGYYITPGFKFGADFLVYLGDPVTYHAIFIVHCVEDSDHAIHPTEIVAFGRLASTVKKRAVLASVKDNQVFYITINWIDT